MPYEDVQFLDMDPEISRPEDLIITHLLVPPTLIRPSVIDNTSVSNENDLTCQLKKIMQMNTVLVNDCNHGWETQWMIDGDWATTQYLVAQYINNDTPGLPPELTKNSIT